MELDIDFVEYMRVIGIIFVLVAAVGGVVAAVTIREHDRQREDAKANSQSLGTWDAESPSSFGHR